MNIIDFFFFKIHLLFSSKQKGAKKKISQIFEIGDTNNLSRLSTTGTSLTCHERNSLQKGAIMRHIKAPALKPT